MDGVLEIHRSYKANDDTATKLTGEEVKRLREYQTDDNTPRTMYIEGVLQYCQWLKENARVESPRLFHYDLTDPKCEAVREQLVRMGQRALNARPNARERVPDPRVRDGVPV
ncbi:hypothetical protein B0H14DRAFT_2627302 [Mycena olivaceomarginata]|nr:hypothetical protein B0H14DRAFT_2627302 [Mycena olivaceomarginata]